MKDEVITTLWKTKDDIGREHDYDLTRVAAMVRQREQEYSERIVDWSGTRKPTVSENPEVAYPPRPRFSLQHIAAPSARRAVAGEDRPSCLRAVTDLVRNSAERRSPTPGRTTERCPAPACA